jgi:hypothetical protein
VSSASRGTTVAQLLAEEILRDGEVVCAEGAHHTATAVVHFAQPDRLLAEPLTTPSPVAVFAAAPGYALELALPRMKSQDVRLVVLCSDEHITASTRWMASRLRIAFVALPGYDSFVVASTLQSLIQHDLTALGNGCRQLTRRLQGRIVSPGQVLAALHETIPYRFLVVGADGVIIAGPRDAEADPDWFASTSVVRLRREGLTVAVPVTPPIGTAADGPSLWLVCLAPPVSDATAELVEGLLGIAALSLAAWAMSERLTYERDLSLRSSALAELLTSTTRVSSNLVDMSVQLGWRLNGWHLGICARIDSRVARSDADLDALGDVLSKAVSRELKATVRFIRLGDRWYGWSTAPAVHSAALYDNLAAAVRRVARPADPRFVFGVGHSRAGGTGLAESLNEAQHLVTFAGHGTGRHTVELARGPLAQRLIVTAIAGEETVDRSKRLLQPLLDLDDRTLLATLSAYLNEESSITATAETLGVHRNTVTKRLERIEKALNLTLNNPESRFALRIACRSLPQP